MIWNLLQRLSPSSLAPPSWIDTSSQNLYLQVVTQSRIPFFYDQCRVLDTPDGHFDMIALHLFLVLNRLDSIEHSRPLVQQLLETFIDDIDANLREMGVSDLRVGKKVRVMAEALYGRLDAYRTAFEKDRSRMSETIARNVFRHRQVSPQSISALLGYFFLQSDFLKKQNDEHILDGIISFAPPPPQSVTL
jgi:cytochrome b pre-mRNA-processing protein 3